MGEFNGKVVLVTGAGRGLGRRAALEFARAGASLALNDLTPIHLDETVAEVETLGAPVRAYTEDVAKRMPVQMLADQVLEDWGRVDALMLAASVRPADRIETMDEWDWHRTLDVNLTAPFLVLQAFAPAMGELGDTAVVMLGPVRKPGQETAHLPAYAASKAGALALARAAAVEFAPQGMRVNAIFSEPGLGLVQEEPAPESPHTYEELVLWLAGPRSKPVTGNAFVFSSLFAS